MEKLMFLLVAILYPVVTYQQNYQVGHRQFNFFDPSRNRTIQTEVYYPATTTGDNVPFANGQFPLLVFGHGFMMSWDSYQWFWDSIVSYGYIMAFPRTEGGISPSHSAFGLDLKFLNDFILSEGNNPSSFFYQHISGTSAIMGHSMGGGASVLAASNNTNLTTLINLAAAETNPSAINAASNVTVPVLMFYGTNDGVTPPADHQFPIYNNLASTCKNLVGIIGGGHCYFANYNFNCSFGESTTNPQPTISREQQQSITWQILLPYLDFMLKNDSIAEQLFYQRLNNLNTITYQRNCQMNYDLGLIGFVSPSNSCGLSSNQQISVIIKNNGINAASNFTLTYIFNNQPPVTEYFSGSIASGDSVIYTFNSTIDAGTPGATYSLLVYITYELDEYAYNDTMSITLTNTSVALPMSVDFTGYDGANLSTVFPGWKEAQGTTPSGNSSTWVSRIGVGSTYNVTAKVNFYGSPIREWMLGPGFLCSQYTYLYFDVALTAYNSTSPYPSSMGTYDSLRIFYSTDCGNTWKRLTAFGKNSGFTNTLQTKVISLSQFAGMGVAIAFQAFRETSSSNDYDLHIDNILIKNEFPYDIAIEELVNPINNSCYNIEPVVVRVKNSGLNDINFTQNSLSVNVKVNNGNLYDESITLASGTLNAGTYIDLNFPSIDMSTHGVYDFLIQTSFSLDGNNNNNIFQKSFIVNNPYIIVSGDSLICGGGDSTTLTAIANAYGEYIYSAFNNTSYNIPDNLGNGVISTITLNIPASVQASSVLEVIIDSIVHPFVGDLRIELYAPNGSYITLVNKRGGNGDNYINTVFTMNATMSITNGIAPFTGQFLPEESFSNLSGSASGTWKLKVMDLGIGDVGTLKKWTIKIPIPNTISSFIWNTGQNTALITVSPISTQAYTVTVTDMNGCSSSYSFTVNVLNQQGNINLGNDTVICQGQTLLLDAGNYQSYVWSNGYTGQTFLVDGSQYSPGTYTFSVTVTNIYGCTETDEIVVTISPCSSINSIDLSKIQVYPNPVTDVLVIENLPYNSYIEIIDRKGLKVYESIVNNNTITIDVNKLPQGIYLLKINSKQIKTFVFTKK